MEQETIQQRTTKNPVIAQFMKETFLNSFFFYFDSKISNHPRLKNILFNMCEYCAKWEER